jgi:uncharacterized protein (DUF3084 family)
VRFNLSEYNWPLIIMIAAVSATVSYVGDILGKKIGKKRISLLGLRPRYTSTVITIFTGIAVAILTLVVAAYSSDSVKMAVFGYNILTRQLTELTNEVRSRQSELDDMTLDLIATENELSSVKNEKQAIETEVTALRGETKSLQNELSSVKNEKDTVEAEVAALKDETESLKRGLEEMKAGRVVVSPGEMLAQTSIEPGENGYPLDEAIEKLIALSDEYLVEKIKGYSINVSPVDAPQVIVTDEMRNMMVSRLRSGEGRKALRLTAPSNVVLGQPVEGVLDVFDSKLIYKEGETLWRERKSGAFSPEYGVDVLYAMLKRVNERAVDRGIKPDPFSGNVGNLSGLDFYDMADKIVALGETANGVVVTITAAEDIYTEGPVRVKIGVGPDEEAQGGE